MGERCNISVVASPNRDGEVLLEIIKYVYKDISNYHVFVCPKFRTPKWIHLLFKFSDCVLYVPSKVLFCSTSIFEPLFLNTFLPHIPHSPWKLQVYPNVLEIVIEMYHI